MMINRGQICDVKKTVFNLPVLLLNLRQIHDDDKMNLRCTHKPFGKPMILRMNFVTSTRILL